MAGITAAIFFMLVPAATRAQVYRFENITNVQGVADRVINAITQDARGFIWIASIDGLTRYDGYKAVVYRHQSNDAGSLSDNEVYALCTDGYGDLWVGTRSGLNRYDAVNDRFEVFVHSSTDPNSLSANEVFTLAKDKAGRLWVGTYNGGLDRIERSGRAGAVHYSFTHYRHSNANNNSLSSDQVLSVCFDNNGVGWIGTTDGLNILDESTKKITRLYADAGNSNTISNKTVNKIVAADNGSVWICGRSMLDNIFYRPGDAVARVTINRMLPVVIRSRNISNWAINDFMTDRNGNYWVATNDQGLIKFKGDINDGLTYAENFTTGQSTYSLVNNTVFSFYEDNAGVIWIGTAKGISKYVPAKARFNERAFSTYSTSGYVKALLQDDSGRLWTGSDSDTLTIKDGNGLYRRFVLPFAHAGEQNQVNCLYQSRAGDIYVGTFIQGLFVLPHNKDLFDKRQWKHVARPQLAGNTVYAITEDSNGIIWVGTYTGLCSYDPASGKTKYVYAPEVKKVVSAYIIRALYADVNGSLWCGTDEGLICIKNDSVVGKFVSDDKNAATLSNNRITNIYGAGNKKIWVGTNAGLNEFDAAKKTFVRFTSREGLPAETIMSTREDSSGNLWMGTNNGLVKFNVAEKKFTRYTMEDGLCGDEFEANSTCADTAGIFYFGTNKGLVSFDPLRIVSNHFIPPVVITDIKILDQPLATIDDTALVNTYRRERRLRLRFDQNFFSFEFAALNYNNPQANQYSYILEGVDRQWHTAGTQRFANYTDIRPGTYTFKVKASNNDGLWNETPATVTVIITPPWWKTWWFYTLCGLFVCGIIYTIYRVRIQQVLKMYRLRSSIARDLHDDVGSALSSIALLSNIAQDGKTSARLKPEDLFNRIGDTSRRMIDLMDDIVWSVNPDNDRFSNMLVRMREYASEMLEARDIDFVFRIAPEIDELRIPMEMRKDYFLIFKEAINNLAKYAGCTHAYVTIAKEGRNISTIIGDDGSGFDMDIINSGNGLKNMQQRAASIKGKLVITSAPGKGTVLSLLMPASG